MFLGQKWVKIGGRPMAASTEEWHMQNAKLAGFTIGGGGAKMVKMKLL